MTKITDQLYLGDALDANHEDIFDHVDKILNVAIELEHHYPAWKKDPSRRSSISFPDDAKINPALIQSCVKHIQEWTKNGDKVLVHCLAGISRSPSIVATYLCVENQFPTYDHAMEHIARLRPKVDPAAAVRISCRLFLEDYKIRQRR